MVSHETETIRILRVLLRDRPAAWPTRFALRLLLVSIGLVILTWIRAYETGYAPVDRSEYGWGHGPWRYVPELRGPLSTAVGGFFLACFLSVAGVWIRPGRWATVVAAVAWIALVVYARSTHWLID